MMQNFFNYIAAHASALGIKTVEQIYLVGLSTFVAIIVGVPLGIWVTYHQRARNLVLGFTSVLQTIPSLALLAFLLPFLGIGVKPALVALAAYALLPIVRNTVTGLDGVPDAMLEAADGLGFTQIQKLWMVKLPLALPVIIAGVRTATAMCVGIATLAAFIGAGGLGDFIYQGLVMDDNRLVLLGAIPAAILALVLDYFIAKFENFIAERKYKLGVKRKRHVLVLAVTSLMLLGLISASAITLWLRYDKNTIVIASKHSTEQIILAELMAQMIQAKTDLHVVRKFNLGSTAVCQAAMLKGEIDIYPEYTGTAYLIILKKTYHKQAPQQIYTIVKKAYAKKFNIIWLKPFGFNDTQAVIINPAFAKKNDIHTISELEPFASRLIVGARPGIIKRADGLPGLVKAYDMRFAEVKLMSAGLMYLALKSNHVNVIMGDSTDGRILAYHLVVLRDNKHFFPAYYAAPVVRAAVLKAHPQIKKALAPLEGLITNKMMQKLNYEVDLGNETPAQVVHKFLVSKGLIRK